MVRLLMSSLILVIALTFIGRLSYLQLFSNTDNVLLEDPSIKAVYNYPERGYIYDRNGQLLVGNQPSYDVMVVPKEVGEFDLEEFCELLRITPEEYFTQLEKARAYSPRLPSVLVSQLSKEDYARLQEKMRHFSGFYIQKKSLRYYNTTAGANVLGYISEANTNDISNSDYYIAGDVRGRTGIEKQYEDILRGEKGISYIQKDNFNRDIGPYKGGSKDTRAKMGKEIHITIDKALQEYGERLMHGKHGGVVAIEPSSGEILAMLSGPTYDPALLVGRERSKNYTDLYYDSINKPTWDRSILAEPSPGSPFKTLNALIALQEGVIDKDTKFRCYNGFYVGKTLRGCHCGGGVRDLNKGIFNSCNAYFAGTFRNIYNKYETTAEGHEHWTKHMKSFGLGDYLGTDLPTGRPGRIPDIEYYDRAYGSGRWASSYIISNAIGQGEVAATPIQLANMTAAIANRGYYFTPHVIKRIAGNSRIDPRYTEPRRTTIDAKHFETVIQGMSDVYAFGTAKHLQIPGVKIAGKTGTVENFTLIDGMRFQLTDHSLFVAFAPVEDPKIAIAVFIEHGYYGGRYAGHIASLMIEKYLKGEITRKDLEKRMLEKTLEHEYIKPHQCEPFEINEYEW